MQLSNQKALIETLKSAARFVWFGLLGLIVTALTTVAASGSLTNSTMYIGSLQVNMSIVVAVVLSAVIKGIDTYIHNNDTVPIAGLAPAFLQQPIRKDVPMAPVTNDVSELRNLLTQVQTEVEAVEASAEKVAETTVAVVKSHLQAALSAVKAGQTTDTAANAGETKAQDGEAAPTA